MCYLQMMPIDLVNLAVGRSELIRKLCLPLLPAPHRPTPQEGPESHLDPPLTPRPQAQPNGHNKPVVTKQPGGRGTGGENQAPLTPDGDDDPRPGKRSKGDDHGLAPGRAPAPLKLDLDPPQGDPDQPPGATGGAGETPPEGSEESQPPLGEGEGEGEAEGHHPLPPPPPEPKPQNGDVTQSLLGTMASLLGTWEESFRQLVEEIQEDLDDYWRKLSIPQ
uniref:E4 protein n=1 Tax=Human papillomavirus TaxID=10566 RepID=A0A385PID9_9PAPI|nr:MAG: E4 protein [Human papillomavirus]